MKNIITFLFIFSAMCVSAFAQSVIPEFEKAKQVKMLESTREDVKRIFASFDDEEEDFDYFHNDNGDVYIAYTTGKCDDENYTPERWDVSEGKVKFIKISLENPVKLKKIGFDLSGFQKENKFDLEDHFIYRNKTMGIAFEVSENKVETIFLFPPLNNYPSACDNKTGKEFYESESWSDDSELRSANIPVCKNAPPKVDDLTLSATEIILACDGKTCFNTSREISITTLASDPENDQLVYNYEISAGKITGSGEKVIWDLSGVAPGTYAITAKADDGCGDCGESKTKEIVVK